MCFFPLQLSGGCELTVVIHDFVAANGGSSGELTVRRGQTVEVLERLHDKPDWCLVRTTDRSPAQEGIVPCSMLCIAHSRSSMEMEGLFNHKGKLGFITSGSRPRLYFLYSTRSRPRSFKGQSVAIFLSPIKQHSTNLIGNN